MDEFKWVVIGEYEAPCCNRSDKFNRKIAAFADLYQAEVFIDKCLPKVNKTRFYIWCTANGAKLYDD